MSPNPRPPPLPEFCVQNLQVLVLCILDAALVDVGLLPLPDRAAWPEDWPRLRQQGRLGWEPALGYYLRPAPPGAGASPPEEDT